MPTNAMGIAMLIDAQCLLATDVNLEGNPDVTLFNHEPLPDVATPSTKPYPH